MVGGEEAEMYQRTQEKTIEVFTENGQIGSGKHIIQD